MKNIILIAQIIVSVLLAASILLQAKGSGLGMAFGDSSQYRSRRGVEKLLHRATVSLAIIFLLVSLLNVISR